MDAGRAGWPVDAYPEVARGGGERPGAAVAPRTSVTCVLPAFNEADAIAGAVADMRAALARFTRDSEIIVVNDGSTDATGQLLDELADDTVRVIHSPVNRGYGWALRAGFAAATRPLVFFTDSDRQFDAMDIGRLLAALGDADIVVGYRVGRTDGPVRNGVSKGYNALVRALLGVQVRDVNCAFKLMRRDTLALLQLTSAGYGINAELLARARQAGLRIREVPVAHRSRESGRSKVSIRDVPPSIGEVLALRQALRRRSLS